ncbi:MAG: hypothetical protein K2H75_02325 [Muribaculaceae bacterium]|nr:hypothetical protein [Muribaculaceae bacterium]
MRTGLDRVGSMLEPDPVAASALLDSIRPQINADSARHALYRLVTIGKLTGRVDNDSLLSIISHFYDDNSSIHPKSDEMIADFYLAYSMTDQGDKGQALRLLEAAERKAEILCDTLYLSRIYAQLGHLYATDYNAPRYIEYSVKALDLSRKKQSYFLVDDIFRLAHAYASSWQDSIAIPLYKEALEMAKAQEDTVLIGRILSEYALSASSYGDNHTALQLCHEADSINALSAETTALFGWLLNENGEKKLADIYMTRALNKSKTEKLEFKNSPLFYSYLINKKNNEPAKALADLENYFSQSETVTRQRLEQQTSRTHLDYYREYNEALQLQIRLRRRIELLTIGLVLVSLVFISCLIWWKWRKKHYEHAMLLASLDTAHAELDLLRQKLTASLEETKKARDNRAEADNTVTNLGKGIELFASLSSTNLELCNLLLKETDSKTTRTQSQLKRSSVQIKETVDKLFSSQHGEILYRWIDRSCKGLITHIREEWPNVSDKALQIIALTVLGMSNSSIMMLLGGSYHSIAQYKVRIREALLRPELPHYSLYKEYL